MTDEELGRAWCAKNGKRPDELRLALPAFRWVCGDNSSNALPENVSSRLGRTWYSTKADAYAAVGAALRELVADSDTLRALADEVRSLEATE